VRWTREGYGGSLRYLSRFLGQSFLPPSLPPSLLTGDDTPDADHLRGLRTAYTALLLQRVRDALAGGKR